MRLGIIGRGPWGDVYAKTLTKMGVRYTQVGSNEDVFVDGDVDGVIIASAPKSHYVLARKYIREFLPALIEKPVCLSSEQAKYLLKLAGNTGCSIVFAGHTRLYSIAWRALKANALAEGVRSVYAVAGSFDCKLSPLWDWGSHLVAMCLDLGFDPLKAHILTGTEEQPLKVIVNGTITYTDQPETPTPLEVLLTEFMAAIEKGGPDIRGLEFGVKVVETLEVMEQETAALYGT